ncbi:MAG: CxxC-x17-CxxC domain-containing protein [Pseudomonadota bacterium]
MKTTRRDSMFDKKDNKRSGRGDSKRPSPGGFSRGGGRDSGRPASDKQMYKAVCNNCGVTCQVPFRPTAGKPVYCSECFSIIADSESPRQKQTGRRRYPDSRRNENFRKSEHSEPVSPDQFKRELDKINLKLDKILGILEDEIF